MTLRVEIDWYHVGFKLDSTAPDYVGTGTDVSSLVKVGENGQPLNLEYGRDQTSALSPTVAGRGALTLANDDRRFSPRNASSPLYGFLRPARPVRITRTVGATTYTLFVGGTDDNPINPDVVAKTASISLVDSLAYFRGVNITTELYPGIRTGEAIARILDACNWPTSMRALDAGATVIPFWWEDNTDALTALDKVLRSEGAPALLTIGAAGEVVFRDRHHRLLSSASLTSQSTWNIDGGAEPVMSVPFEYDEAWRNIINTAAVSVDVRLPQPAEVIWESEDAITLSAGEQRVVNVVATDPFYDAVTPEINTDYVVDSGTVTISLSRTSGTSTDLTFTAGGSGAVLRGLKLRANPVKVSHTVQISDSDPASVEIYGARSFQGDLPWCTPYDAEAVATTTVSTRSNPLPVVKAEFFIPTDARADALLPLNLSDRVTINETETQLSSASFYIEAIEHNLTADFDHRISFGTEMAPAGITPVFRFDTAGQGFDDGKLNGGLDNSDTIFLFADTGGSATTSSAFRNFDFDTDERQALTHDWSEFQVGDSHQHAWITTKTRLGSGHAERFEIHDNTTTDRVDSRFRSMMDCVDTNDGGISLGGVEGYNDVYWCWSSYLPASPDAEAEIVSGFAQTAAPDYEHLLEIHERSNVNGSDVGINNLNDVANLAVMVRSNQLQFRGRCGTFTWNSGSSSWDKPSWNTGTPGTNGSNDQIPIPIVKSGGTNATLPMNTWIDIIWHIYFSTGSDGLIEIWARAAGQTFTTSPNLTINGPTHKVLVGSDAVTRTSAEIVDEGGVLCTGCYMHCGLYTGDSTWTDATNDAHIHIIDELRRYDNKADALNNWGGTSGVGAGHRFNDGFFAT